MEDVKTCLLLNETPQKKALSDKNCECAPYIEDLKDLTQHLFTSRGHEAPLVGEIGPNSKRLCSGQSYNQFTIVIYDSRVVIWVNFKSNTTLES